MSVRTLWIDGWKGLLILLVVVGHAVGSACHTTTGGAREVYELIYKIIYFFHMPAFFWVVGMCWKAQPEPFGLFVRKRADRLLVPYAVFGVISALLFALAGGVGHIQADATDSYYAGMSVGAWWQPIVALIHGGGWPNGEGFRCNSVLWFLPAMFTVSCAYYGLDRILKQKWGQLAIAGVLLVGAFCVDHFRLGGLPWGISVVPLYLPFVIFGRWVRMDEWKRIYGHWALLIVGWLIFALLAWVTPNRYQGVHSFGWYLVFLAMTFAGVVLSALTARALGRKAVGIFSALGLASMGIMLMHKFVILGLQLKVPYINAAVKGGGWESAIAVGVIVVVATSASYFASKMPIVRKVV